jgi:serine/threonine protein kinase
MAPEQTGRMNRSIDSRSDLYALGVTFYQMLTGRLPFSATDPMEWVHCHIARKPATPAERLESVPTVISEIVMKLLAKTAEERCHSRLFSSVHAQVHNHFNQERHLITREICTQRRAAALGEWRALMA